MDDPATEADVAGAADDDVVELEDDDEDEHVSESDGNE